MKHKTGISLNRMTRLNFFARNCGRFISMNNSAVFVLSCCILSGAGACRQSYSPPLSATSNTYLVVEGFINNGPDSTIFAITHTYMLSGIDTATPELHAQVTVEGKDNSSWSLGETGNGNYGAALSVLNNSIQYRLHIRTSSGKEYASDYVDMKLSPPIDSVNWTLSSSGVQLFVNTHDPNNASRYYRWDYQQTWKFASAYFAFETYDTTTGLISPLGINHFDTCWKNSASTDILLGSSAKLAGDVIYQFPLLTIPSQSEQISLKYSSQVRQYVLTPDAFAWWQKMQKNTEQIGSIFGVQPSSMVGNIHNVADTSEPVIGYVSAGSISKKRIFISNAQVSPWTFMSDCQTKLSSRDSLNYFYGAGFLLIGNDPNGSSRWQIAFRTCVDCRFTGTNQTPSFWQ
jgi:uncharacterized protein DUF4249